ncbi:single-stranded DNA-binding protein [Nocardiopsis sp. CC223A]|uniref:single-stranded DNA-binding protein n=1 Tax=Nocardiopsis sp. CC223A TaxID=3044051 RepID=UPI0027959637|nr:single-stranded DNA-binding protein [Nocardiopsis sp. CC223A]
MWQNGARGTGQDARGAGDPGRDEGHRNEVLLVGRITAEPVFRKMANGNRLASWRMCMARPAREGVSGRRSDAVYCVGFDSGLHPDLEEWRLGDVVRVTGALRRRFWHGRPEERSTCEVEARTVALVRRSRPGPGGAPGDAPVVPSPRAAGQTGAGDER